MTMPLDPAAIRERHEPFPWEATCSLDEQPWPCETTQLAVALEAAQRDNERLREALGRIVAKCEASTYHRDYRAAIGDIRDMALILLAAVPATERIADDNGDDLEHGAPDYPGQFPERRWADDWRNPANLADSVAYTDAIENDR